MITSYDDMPVGVYEKLTAIVDEKMPEDAERLAVLSVLTGKSEDELLDEPLGKFRKQMDAAGFLLVLPRPAEVRKIYKLDGVRYVPTLREDKMTAGQYIDFQTYAGQKGDQWAGILSCILVPEGKTYNDGYDIGDVQKAVRDHLCILDAIALRAFFLNSSALLTAATARCSLLTQMRKAGAPLAEREKLKAKMLRVEAALRADGGGFRALTAWLKLPDALGMWPAL